MIESTLLIVIACDRCESQVEHEEVLESLRPEIALLEMELWFEARNDGWAIAVDHAGEETHICPECVKADDAENDDAETPATSETPATQQEAA